MIGRTFGEAIIKTVKLKEQPSLIELTKQVELINNSFDEICNSGKNLTIRLQKVLPEAGESEQGGDKGNSTKGAKNGTNNAK